MTFMTTDELLQRRNELAESLDLLYERSDTWSRSDRTRGAATIENLTQQMADIDQELEMAGAA
ncbi:hypothetical protein NJC40_03700 [Pseudomonas sp. 21LCFQ02]|uniref:hypothetical protein n=1 Tax=Pseudomonas sp. 21LCFQ02 TaxID=2957505 RepID=UPI00209B06AA|nr:hypothetical protein [Pseudomonas sp. 21LCFQ02]MCO8166883.1 hypothetical protein [Pseudomonas sp. 21LCFQ02]